MYSIAEREEDVPLIETTLRPISDRPSVRIRQKESLDYNFLMENLDPHNVRQIQICSGEGMPATVGVYNVFSPYTQGGLHVMLLDTTNRYRPTPSEIPESEGIAMMDISARIIRFMQQMNGFEIISWGYNNSPLNFGVEEERGGGIQSLPTKHHIQIYNRKRELPIVPISTLSEPVRNFIQGDSLNKFAGTIIKTIVERSATDWVDMQTVGIDTQGFHAKLSTDLLSFLKTPNVFSVHIQPLHNLLESASVNLWDALITVPYRETQQIIRYAFEKGNIRSYDLLQEHPVLRPLADRRERLISLETKGYTPHEIRQLLILNSLLQNRDTAAVAEWVRKGLGYSLVITQDPSEKEATIYIRPAIKIATSRGGTLETQHIALKRSEAGNDGDRDEIEQNKVNIAHLREVLPTNYICEK